MESLEDNLSLDCYTIKQTVADSTAFYDILERPDVEHVRQRCLIGRRRADLFMKYIARFTYGVQAIEEIHETVSRQQLQIVKLMRWLVNIVF